MHFNMIFILGFLCAVLAAVSAQNVTCVVPKRENGQILLTNSRIQGDQVNYGTGLALICNDGFSIDDICGVVIQKCWQDGTWQPPGLTNCKESCTFPGNIDNGHFSTGTLTVGSELKIICKPGFAINGSATIHCGKELQWTTGGTCVPVCSTSTLPNIENGRYPPPDCPPFTGSHQLIVCDEGYELVGPQVIFCKSDGTWEELKSYCRPKSTTPQPQTGGQQHDGYWKRPANGKPNFQVLFETPNTPVRGVFVATLQKRSRLTTRSNSQKHQIVTRGELETKVLLVVTQGNDLFAFGLPSPPKRDRVSRSVYGDWFIDMMDRTPLWQTKLELIGADPAPTIKQAAYDDKTKRLFVVYYGRPDLIRDNATVWSTSLEKHLDSSVSALEKAEPVRVGPFLGPAVDGRRECSDVSVDNDNNLLWCASYSVGDVQGWVLANGSPMPNTLQYKINNPRVVTMDNDFSSMAFTNGYGESGDESVAVLAGNNYLQLFKRGVTGRYEYVRASTTIYNVMAPKIDQFNNILFGYWHPTDQSKGYISIIPPAGNVTKPWMPVYSMLTGDRVTSIELLSIKDVDYCTTIVFVGLVEPYSATRGRLAAKSFACE